MSESLIGMSESLIDMSESLIGMSGSLIEMSGGLVDMSGALIEMSGVLRSWRLLAPPLQRRLELLQELRVALPGSALLDSQRLTHLFPPRDRAGISDR